MDVQSAWDELISLAPTVAVTQSPDDQERVRELATSILRWLANGGMSPDISSSLNDYECLKDLNHYSYARNYCQVCLEAMNNLQTV